MIVNKLFFQKIYSLHVFWFGSVLLPPPKMDQKYKNLLIPPFFYSSIGPVWLMLWSWNLVSWYNLSNWVCWYIVCCVAPLVFADSAKTRKINVLLKILFFYFCVLQKTIISPIKCSFRIYIGYMPLDQYDIDQHQYDVIML